MAAGSSCKPSTRTEYSALGFESLTVWFSLHMQSGALQEGAKKLNPIIESKPLLITWIKRALEWPVNRTAYKAAESRFQTLQ